MQEIIRDMKQQVAQLVGNLDLLPSHSIQQIIEMTTVDGITDQIRGNFFVSSQVNRCLPTKWKILKCNSKLNSLFFRVNNQWNRSDNVGSNMSHQRSQVYQNQPPQSYNVSQNNSSYGRYEPYKSSVQNVRKYQ